MSASEFLSQASRPIFLQPEVLPTLLLVPLAFWWLHRTAKNRRQRLQAMLGDRLESALHQAQGTRLLTARICFAAALLCSILAIAQPSWGEQQQQLKSRNADIAICLDVSRSMLAADQRPTRLEAARSAIHNLTELAAGDRFALIHFAGLARLAIPLTEDLQAYSELLKLSQPSSVRLGGSDLGAALQQALESLPQEDGVPRSIVVLSDGEDWGEKAIASAQACAVQNIVIHCIGYGSQLGSKIAIEGGFMQDLKDADVISKLNSDTLMEVSQLTGGLYLEAAVTPNPLLQIYQNQILKMPRSVRDDGLGSSPQNRYQWPLALACLLWLLEGVLVLPRRK